MTKNIFYNSTKKILILKMPQEIKTEIITRKYHFSELDIETQQLTIEAQKVAENAYAPYSNFLVGAALLLEDGSIVKGNNQENAAYPSGLCAERTALFYYGSLNNRQNIKKIAVTARKADNLEYLNVTPCGACRQVMSEYENKQDISIEVWMQSDNNSWILCQSVADLLPFMFSSKSLK
jgi:cytidine deaminase